MLTVVGRSQLGRLRYTGTGETLDEDVPFQSVDEILAHRRGGDFYRYLIERFASYSGISGVQPKVLIRDQPGFSADDGEKLRFSSTFRGATHLQPEGGYCGFEDFCVLNARRTDEKYRGSYETHVMRRFQQFARSTSMIEESLQLFTLIALNCVLRNGDAHLKNFGVVYGSVQGEAHLAPVYDLVTTTVYIPEDRMALTLNGTSQWPSAKDLIRFAEGKSLASRKDLIRIFERISNATTEVAADIRTYSLDHPEFTEIGNRMLEEWNKARSSLVMGS